MIRKFLNVATRKLKITSASHIIFLLEVLFKVLAKFPIY